MEDGHVNVSWRLTSSAEQLVKGPPQTLRMHLVCINTIRPKCCTLVFCEAEITSAFSAPRLYGQMCGVRQLRGTTCSALKWPQQTFCYPAFVIEVGRSTATILNCLSSSAATVSSYSFIWRQQVGLKDTVIKRCPEPTSNCNVHWRRT